MCLRPRQKCYGFHFRFFLWFICSFDTKIQIHLTFIRTAVTLCMVKKENHCQNWFVPWRTWTQATQLLEEFQDVLSHLFTCRLPIRQIPIKESSISFVLHAEITVPAGCGKLWFRGFRKTENLRRILGNGKSWISRSRWREMAHTSGLRTDHIMAVPDTFKASPVHKYALPHFFLQGRRYFVIPLITLDNVDSRNLNLKDAAMRLGAWLLHQWKWKTKSSITLSLFSLCIYMYDLSRLRHSPSFAYWYKGSWRGVLCVGEIMSSLMFPTNWMQDLHLRLAAFLNQIYHLFLHMYFAWNNGFLLSVGIAKICQKEDPASKRPVAAK